MQGYVLYCTVVSESVSTCSEKYHDISLAGVGFFLGGSSASTDTEAVGDIFPSFAFVAVISLPISSLSATS